MRKYFLKKDGSLKNRSFFILLFGIILCFILFDFNSVAFAEDVDLESGDEEQILNLHEDMESILHIDNGWMYQDVIRAVGWGLIKLLVLITDYFEGAVDKILGWNTFFKSSEIKELMNKVMPFIMGLFLLSLVYIGYLIMFNKIEKRNEVVLNVIMAFLLIFIIPNAMPYLDEVFKVGKDALDDSMEVELSMSDSIIKMNVADIKYYAEEKFNFNKVPKPINKAEEGESGGTSANYTKGNEITSPKDISINEKIDLQSEDGWFPWTTGEYRKDLKENNKVAFDLFLTRAVPDGKGGVRLKELAKNKVPATAIGQEAYYRYHVNWGTSIFTYAIVAFALAVTVLKIARIIFELAFHGIFVMAISATDMTGGQRTKKVVTEIVSSFAVLLVMVLIVKLFIYYTNWTLGLSGSIGSIASILMLMAGAWALLDAPDIVSRVLGIDAGLRSGWQTMMGAYAGAKMAGGGIKGLAKGVGAGAKGANSAVQFGKGLVGKSPVKDGSKNVKQMPDTTGVDSSSTTSNESNNSSIPNQNKKEGNSSSIPSSTNIGGNESQSSTPNDNSSNSIPDNDDYIKPNDNPYNTGYGVYSGSQAGQRSADRKARAYNSGVKARQNLTSFGKSLGNVGMLGARFVRNPIQSTKNLGGMAMARASEMKSSMAAMPAKVASNVSNSVGGFNQASKVPIGQSSTPQMSESNVSDSVEVDTATTQRESTNVGAIPSKMNMVSSPRSGKSMKITQKGIENVKRSVNTIQKNGGTINTSRGQVTFKTPNVQSVNTSSVQDKFEVTTKNSINEISSGTTSMPNKVKVDGFNKQTSRRVQINKENINTIKRNNNIREIRNIRDKK